MIFYPSMKNQILTDRFFFIIIDQKTPKSNLNQNKTYESNCAFYNENRSI